MRSSKVESQSHVPKQEPSRSQSSDPHQFLKFRFRGSERTPSRVDTLRRDMANLNSPRQRLHLLLRQKVQSTRQRTHKVSEPVGRDVGRGAFCSRGGLAAPRRGSPSAVDSWGAGLAQSRFGFSGLERPNVMGGSHRLIDPLLAASCVPCSFRLRCARHLAPAAEKRPSETMGASHRRSFRTPPDQNGWTGSSMPKSTLP